MYSCTRQIIVVTNTYSQELGGQRHLHDVAGLRTAVDKLVLGVDDNGGDGALVHAPVAVGGANLAIGEVKVPDAQVQLTTRHEFQRVARAEANTLRGFVRSRRATHGVTRCLI